MRDIDAIVRELHLAHPGISAERLAVLHPGADDDGLWFFRHTAGSAEVQLESATGNVPFLVEGLGVERHTAATVQQAVALVVAGLGLSGPAA